MTSFISTRSGKNEMTISDEKLWDTYFSHASPKLKGNFPEKENNELKIKIKELINRFSKNLKDENSTGEMVYKRGRSAYVVHLKQGSLEENELEDWNFYKLYLKPALYHILKKDNQLKDLQYFETSFYPFVQKQASFEIFKIHEFSIHYPFNKTGRDFELKSKTDVIPLNVKDLIQSGGSVMSALVRYAIENEMPYTLLNLEHYSSKTVANYKKFVSSAPMEFLKEIKENSVGDICELYKLAHECACSLLKNYCVEILTTKDCSQHLFLLRELIIKHKDKGIQKIYDKFQPEEMMFDMELT